MFIDYQQAVSIQIKLEILKERNFFHLSRREQRYRSTTWVEFPTQAVIPWTVGNRVNWRNGALSVTLLSQQVCEKLDKNLKKSVYQNKTHYISKQLTNSLIHIDMSGSMLTLEHLVNIRVDYHT